MDYYVEQNTILSKYEEQLLNSTQPYEYFSETADLLSKENQDCLDDYDYINSNIVSRIARNNNIIKILTKIIEYQQQLILTANQITNPKVIHPLSLKAIYLMQQLTKYCIRYIQLEYKRKSNTLAAVLGILKEIFVVEQSNNLTYGYNGDETDHELFYDILTNINTKDESEIELALSKTLIMLPEIFAEFYTLSAIYNNLGEDSDICDDVYEHNCYVQAQLINIQSISKFKI